MNLRIENSECEEFNSRLSILNSNFAAEFKRLSWLMYY